MAEKGSVRYLDTNKFSSAVSAFKSGVEEYISIKDGVKDTTNTLMERWKGEGKTQFEKDYQTIYRQLTDIADIMYELRDAMIDAQAAYMQTDEELGKITSAGGSSSKKGGGAENGSQSSGQDSGNESAAGKGGGTTSSGNQNTGNKNPGNQNTGNKGGGTTSSGNQNTGNKGNGQGTGQSRYPSYRVDSSTHYSTDKKGIPYYMAKCKNGGYNYAAPVLEGTMKGTLSCTYNTQRRLAEKGLAYPFAKSGGNGRDWYASFDKDSGLLNASGTNALNELINKNGLPLKNVVASFAYAYGEQFKNYGHVLLIDEIYRDESGGIKVRFGDNYDYDAQQSVKYDRNNPDNFGTHSNVRSLEEFMRLYKAQVLNGAVVVGE